MTAYRRKWTPLAPDLTKARKWREATFATWTSEGHDGSLSPAEDVDEALADLSEEDGAAAAERALRYIRARQQAHRKPVDVLSYVRKRVFDHYPPPPARGDDMFEVKLRSKEWDVLFWRYALAGDIQTAAKARSMERDARLKKPLYVRRDEIPTEAEMAPFVKVQRDSEPFKAWGRHLVRRPSELIVWVNPKVFGRWPHVPSVWPPLDDAGRIAEAKREDRERSKRTQGRGAAA